MKTIILLLTGLLFLACPNHLPAEYTNEQDDKKLERDELEKRRAAFERPDDRRKNSEASRSGFFRVWNFADPSVERISVILKNKEGEVVPISRSIRSGISTAYRLLPAQEYQIQIYRPLPVTRNEDGTIAKPELKDDTSLLRKPLSLDLDPRTCHTLLIRGSLPDLSLELMQDFDADGQAAIRIINTLDTTPLSVAYGREPKLTSVVYQFDAGNTTKRFNLTTETDFHIFYKSENGNSARRITSLDYGIASHHSLVFHLDRYNRPTITATRDGYQAALLDQ